MLVVEEVRRQRSQLKKQVGILATIYRFLQLCFKSGKFEKTPEEVEAVFVRHDQNKHFQGLIRELERGHPTRTYSELKPFIDSVCLVRVETGVHKSAAFSWDAKRPVLLHADMDFAKDLMESVHVEVLAHQNGLEGLLGEARKRF